MTRKILLLIASCAFISACLKTDLEFAPTEQLQAFINVNNNNQKTQVTVDFKHAEYSYFKLGKGEQLQATLAGEQKPLKQKLVANDLFSAEFSANTELQTLNIDYSRPKLSDANASIVVPAVSYFVAPLPATSFLLNDDVELHWAPAGLSDTLKLKAKVSCNTQFTQHFDESELLSYALIDFGRTHPGWVQGKKLMT